MKITDLLKLYHDFFDKLCEIENSYPDIIEQISDEEIDDLVNEFNLNIPDDIREFLKASKKVYSISRDINNEEWEAGFDFCDIDIIRRDIPMYRNDLAKNYEDGSFIKHLHLKGVPLSYSEPALLFDADPETKKSKIYLMLWDGEPSENPITSDFTTFFTHWLASGCFRARDFKKYWEVVKDFVPIKIPPKENLWLKYYHELYNEEIPNF